MRHALYLAPFGELAHPSALADVVEAAESAGWDAVFVWDHIWRDPARVEEVGDAWISLAAAACRTQRIRLGPMVVPLSRRRPQKVAREAVALDLLSKGRLTLGVGLGVNTAGELTRFGEEDDAQRRAARLDEALEVLLALWSGEEVRHRGEFFCVDDVRFVPVAEQRPRIPVWGAARTGSPPRPVRRAARLDGFFPVGVGRDELASMLDRLRRERGGLDGFDVAVVPPEGAGTAELASMGVTWLVTSLGERVTRADALAVAARTPA